MSAPPASRASSAGSKALISRSATRASSAISGKRAAIAACGVHPEAAPAQQPGCGCSLRYSAVGVRCHSAISRSLDRGPAHRAQLERPQTSRGAPGGMPRGIDPEMRRETEANRTGRLASQSSRSDGQRQIVVLAIRQQCDAQAPCPLWPMICNRLINAPPARPPSSSTRRGNSATRAPFPSSRGRPCNCRTSAIEKILGSGGNPISKHAAAGSRTRKTKRSLPERNRAKSRPRNRLGAWYARPIRPYPNFGADLVLDDDLPADQCRSTPNRTLTAVRKPPRVPKTAHLQSPRRNCRQSARMRRVFGCCHR